ncbi:MAG: hypothetical protein HQ541_18065 [Mariniphaga sp.]|nr:hypothetical protein [Mariniphaga sp.]
MKSKLLVLIIFILLFLNGITQPIALHPYNPHYFVYDGKPTLLITSAEHYGAVLNLDFGYKKYLKTMSDEGMNYTRIFTGSYVEIPGSFNIENNTLSPVTGRFITPWKRTSEPGLFKGENKFDLSQWDEEYFMRLNDFISEADKYDIVVEVTLFCSTYQDASWERNPFNHQNNINGLPVLDRKKSNTIYNGELIDYQKKMVQKIVFELNDFDNVFYEIQNEPWSDDPQKATRILWTHDPATARWTGYSETASKASLAWQKIIAQTIVDTEKKMSKKHLIAQNYCNFKHSLEEIDPNISILNFHYAWPDAAWLNYAWNRPIGFDESGFSENSDTTYLRQAWSFMLAGGALFNNLDYSFAVGYEDGTAKSDAPGKGSKELRAMLKRMHNFIKAFDFIKMAPDRDVVFHSPGLISQALSEKGKQYAIYFSGKPSGFIKLDLPKGRYNYELISPYDGKPLKKGFTTHDGGIYKMEVPGFDQMAVLRILNQK